MLRRGATAIHYVCEEIPEGSEVDLAIDWSRRFDHMQQHSGKHFYMISSLLVGLSPLHRFSVSYSRETSNDEKYDESSGLSFFPLPVILLRLPPSCIPEP